MNNQLLMMREFQEFLINMIQIKMAEQNKMNSFNSMRMQPDQSQKQ